VGNLAPRTTPHSLTPIISSQVPARESDTNFQRDRILDLLFRQRLHAMKLMRLSRLPTCMQPAQRASEPCPEGQKPIGLRVPRLKRTLTMVHLRLRKTPDTSYCPPGVDGTGPPVHTVDLARRSSGGLPGTVGLRTNWLTDRTEGSA
jgi:hypothetical protein